MKFPVLLTLPAGLLVGLLAEPQQAPPFVPIDPQRVQDQQAMTWQDYRPIPGTNWADNSVPGARVLAGGPGRGRLPGPAVRHHDAEAV